VAHSRAGKKGLIGSSTALIAKLRVREREGEEKRKKEIEMGLKKKITIVRNEDQRREGEREDDDGICVSFLACSFPLSFLVLSFLYFSLFIVKLDLSLFPLSNFSLSLECKLLLFVSAKISTFFCSFGLRTKPNSSSFFLSRSYLQYFKSR